MNPTANMTDVVDELRQLAQGQCIWCELGINHPAYSPCLRQGERSTPSAAALPRPFPGEIARFGEQDEFVLRMAVAEEDRLKAWHLVYQEYLLHGYTQPQELALRYSLHDALPDTATFLVEKSNQLIGTVTVFPDSPLGLPADETYQEEIDALRQAGRDPVEIGRLAIRQDLANDRRVLVNLLDALSLYARCVRRATDLVITVNPSHAKFYERAILFGRIGGQKDLGSVCGAAAVLLRLDLSLEEKARRWAHGEGPRPEVPIGGHTAYPHVSGLAEEEARVSRMRQVHRRPGEAFIRRYFVRVRPLIPELPSSLRYFFEQCYPGLRSAWVEQETWPGSGNRTTPANTMEGLT